MGLLFGLGLWFSSGSGCVAHEEVLGEPAGCGSGGVALKALMAEQVSDLLGKKIPATFINSDLGTDEKDLRYSLLTRQAPAPSGRQLLRGGRV